MPQLNPKEQIIKRSCVICGKRITITVYPDRTYTGGYYFGKIKINKNNAE